MFKFLHKRFLFVRRWFMIYFVLMCMIVRMFFCHFNNFYNYLNEKYQRLKEKYGLRDKGDALDKFAEIFGDDYIEKEASDEYMKKFLKIEEEHFKKYGYKKMSDKELDELFGK